MRSDKGISSHIDCGLHTATVAVKAARHPEGISSSNFGTWWMRSDKGISSYVDCGLHTATVILSQLLDNRFA